MGTAIYKLSGKINFQVKKTHIPESKYICHSYCQDLVHLDYPHNGKLPNRVPTCEVRQSSKKNIQSLRRSESEQYLKTRDIDLVEVCTSCYMITQSNYNVCAVPPPSRKGCISEWFQLSGDPRKKHFQQNLLEALEFD